MRHIKLSDICCTLCLSIRLCTMSLSPQTGTSSASWGSARYSQSFRAWRASVNLPEKSSASSSLCCLRKSKPETKWGAFPISGPFSFFFLMLGRNLNPVPIDCIIPLHGLAADGVPRVFEFSHLIFQMLSVTAGLSSLVKVASVLRCGVVHGPLRSQQLLELLTSD